MFIDTICLKQKIEYLLQMSITVDNQCGFFRLFEKIRSDDSAGTKCTPNSDFFGMQWVFVSPNAAILLVNKVLNQK